MSLRTKTRPLMVAVREDLEARIAMGAYRLGTRLPPEPDLASELRVSRATLREALRSLEEEGLVRRTRGAGTFVQDRPRVANNLDLNFGVSDAIRAAGMRPGSVRATARIEAADPAEAGRLRLEPGEEVAVNVSV